MAGKARIYRQDNGARRLAAGVDGAGLAGAGEQNHSKRRGECADSAARHGFVQPARHPVSRRARRKSSDGLGIRGGRWSLWPCRGTHRTAGLDRNHAAHHRLLSDPRTRLARLEVFALGHTGAAAEGAEGGYFALRILLARSLALAVDTSVHKGAAHGTSAVAHRALSPIVTRFGAIISQKLAVQGVAVIGAFGGAAINLAFVEYFHGLARGHFTVRPLERVYGAEAVRAEHDRIRAAYPQQSVRIADMS